MSDAQPPARGLSDELAALDIRALDLLGVLALANDWQSETRWFKLASATDVRVGGKSLPKSQARGWIETFVEQKLVNVGLLGRQRHYKVCQAIAPAVVQHLHDRGRLAKLDGRASPGWGARDYGRWHDSGPAQLETDLRIATLERNPKAIERVVAQARRCLHRQDFGKWWVLSLGPATPPAILDCLSEAHRLAYLKTLVEFARSSLEPIADHLIDAALEIDDKKLRLELGRVLILRGQPERALELDGLPKYGRAGLELLAAFWAGDYAEAARIGDETVASMTRKRKALYELEGLCHVLAGLACSGGDPKRLEALVPVIEICATGKLGEAIPHGIADVIHAGLMGRRRGLRAVAVVRMDDGQGWTSAWVRALHDIWLDLRYEPKRKGDKGDDRRDDALVVLRAWARLGHAHGFAPVAREFEALARAYAGGDEAERAANTSPTLAGALRVPEPWETVLAGLDAIVERAQAVPEARAEQQKSREVIWELRIGKRGIGVTPRVRSVRSKSKTMGRKVSLEALVDAKDVRMAPADDEIVEALEFERALSFAPWQMHPSSPRLGVGAGTLAALVGHPRVIDEDGRPVEVERGEPSLHTEQSKGRLRVELRPARLLERALCWDHSETQAGTKLTIYQRPPALEEALEVLGRGIEIPARAADRLARTLSRLSVSAGVEVVGALEPKAEERVADPRPTLVLDWDGEGLAVDARVAPLGLDGPQLLPGIGKPAISAEIGEDAEVRLVQCERDLAEERRRMVQLERSAPTLAAYVVGPHSWSVATLVDALEALLELGALGDAIVLAWPQGKALRPPIERELGDLALAVSSGGDWLELDARLELDEGQVLSFRELLERRESPRFVALGEGRFVALSEQLRRRIDALAKLGPRKSGRVRTSPAMLAVVEQLGESLAETSFDDRSRAQLERVRELAEARPRRPRGFGAELRDYQREGYAWMWRLAEAGLGACLADDMGLGKTVQALALLSQRAAKGPAVVVCPTSVVHNWVAETQRFAPSLRPAVLAEAPDRAELLEACRARDLIVCSYGLLVSEAEALHAVEFATVVFDEAHALKNERTKRAKAAREITAGFRLGLTGTPVENRVAELWSLFRVLVPGLLGTRKQFDTRFAKPITHGEREAASQLRTILAPFILRRTKAQVLDELPPRTELTLEIEPTAKARAYYEALRRRALESVEGGDPRNKRFRILAEITRLRQAAVDPRLLDERGAPPGAKIDALVEQVLTLREEGHRALVFTQFLTSMALLRAAFEAAGVEYLELDGATPAAERARRVDAFQAGEGDVFILSLRAGGVGMNLTGADYVLHLDPWWNPAVEDQATDRAHRIGQSRPVTVYRFVSVGTIEQKILGLHADKRELADDLLTGMEGAGALDVDELIDLLGEVGQ